MVHGLAHLRDTLHALGPGLLLPGGVETSGLLERVEPLINHGVQGLLYHRRPSGAWGWRTYVDTAPSPSKTALSVLALSAVRSGTGPEGEPAYRDTPREAGGVHQGPNHRAERLLMDTRTIRNTNVTLPALDEPGLYIAGVTSLEGGRGRMAEFHYADADLRDLDLTDIQLLVGRITGLKTQRARFDKLRVDSVEFSGCDLSSLHWVESRISRTAFRDCKLMGGVLEDVTLENVLFENCKLDYSTFTRVRTAGPVIFSACSLRETTFAATDLGSALIDDSDLRSTEFDGGSNRGLDLRGNDISQLRGLASLKQIVIDRAQTLQLAEALATELDVTYGEDLDE
ncbi:pentapeptide repeat-containing protein [Streptomyces sp. NPDC004838]